QQAVISLCHNGRMNDPSDFMHAPRPTSMPALIPFARFSDADAAVEQLLTIYARNTAFIRDAFRAYSAGRLSDGQRVRACYPAIRIRVDSYPEVDSRLSYGHLVEPGMYMITVTQPALFRDYLREQVGLLMRNHRVPVEIGESDMPIPLHFAFPEGEYVEGEYMESPGHTL